MAAKHDLQGSLEEVLSEEGLTGVVWALIDGNGESNLGAAGFRDHKTQSGFTTDTGVHVGSITKTLLSVGVLSDH